MKHLYDNIRDEKEAVDCMLQMIVASLPSLTFVQLFIANGATKV